MNKEYLEEIIRQYLQEVRRNIRKGSKSSISDFINELESYLKESYDTKHNGFNRIEIDEFIASLDDPKLVAQDFQATPYEEILQTKKTKQRTQWLKLKLLSLTNQFKPYFTYYKEKLLKKPITVTLVFGVLLGFLLNIGYYFPVSGGGRGFLVAIFLIILFGILVLNVNYLYNTIGASSIILLNSFLVFLVLMATYGIDIVSFLLTGQYFIYNLEHGYLAIEYKDLYIAAPITSSFQHYLLTSIHYSHMINLMLLYFIIVICLTALLIVRKGRTFPSTITFVKIRPFLLTIIVLSSFLFIGNYIWETSNLQGRDVEGDFYVFEPHYTTIIALNSYENQVNPYFVGYFPYDWDLGFNDLKNPLFQGLNIGNNSSLFEFVNDSLKQVNYDFKPSNIKLTNISYTLISNLQPGINLNHIETNEGVTSIFVETHQYFVYKIEEPSVTYDVVYDSFTRKLMYFSILKHDSNNINNNSDYNEFTLIKVKVKKSFTINDLNINLAVDSGILVFVFASLSSVLYLKMNRKYET